MLELCCERNIYKFVVRERKEEKKESVKNGEIS